MTQYTTLIEIDSSLTIVVSGEKMPTQNDYMTLSGLRQTDFFKSAYAAWLKAASKYPIVDKENEDNFKRLVLSTANVFDLGSDLNVALKIGFLIPNERVQIKSNCCGRCDGVSDECDAIDVAYFVPPIPRSS